MEIADKLFFLEGEIALLYEDDVVSSVCDELRSLGFDIVQQLTSTQYGIDIVAKKGGRKPFELHIEAKGATSARNGSKRYGKSFSSSQVGTHVAKALYKACEAYSTKNIKAGIALPDNTLHRNCINEILPALTALNIVLFWVQENGKVVIEPPFAFNIENLIVNPVR